MDFANILTIKTAWINITSKIQAIAMSILVNAKKKRREEFNCGQGPIQTTWTMDQNQQTIWTETESKQTIRTATENKPTIRTATE